jgi:hypothetical protein
VLHFDCNEIWSVDTLRCPHNYPKRIRVLITALQSYELVSGTHRRQNMHNPRKSFFDEKVAWSRREKTGKRKMVSAFARLSFDMNVTHRQTQ